MTDSRGVPGMTLLDKQKLFARLLGNLITFIYGRGWAVTMGEGFVGQTEAAEIAAGGKHVGPHMLNGAHYNKLGQDLNLFVQGVYVSGGHPAWDEIGATWKGFGPMCRWGGDFMSRDWNHVSIFHDGVA